MYRHQTHLGMPRAGGFGPRPSWGPVLTASLVFGLATASVLLLPTLPWLGLLTLALEGLVVTWLGARWRPGLDA